MQAIKTEGLKLIQEHMKELTAAAEELGGVLILGLEGSVAVYGAEDSKKKIIFRTSFVSNKVNELLDAQVWIQDLLEEAGVEVISEHDFLIAIGAH